MEIDSKKIKIYLAESRMTQATLAKITGIARQNISAIISKGRCSTVTAGKLADGLGVHVSEIMREVPDNDDPGRKYAQMCAEKLHGVAAAVWVLDLKKAWPEIPEKGDISDLISHFGEDDAMRKVMGVLQTTPQWDPDQAASKDPFLSLFKPLTDFTEEEATWLIPGWIPESQITLIAADGGVGKTTLWCNIMASLSSGRPCILDPEGYRRKPMKRKCGSLNSVFHKFPILPRAQSSLQIVNLWQSSATSGTAPTLRPPRTLSERSSGRKQQEMAVMTELPGCWRL